MAAGDGVGGRGSAVPLSRRELGRALKRLRTEAGALLEDVARELAVTPATVSRWETGKRVPQVADVRRLAAMYAEDDLDEVARLVALTEKARRPGWWEGYREFADDSLTALIAYEAEASRIDYYQGLIVPGLLQTADYARNVYHQIVAPVLALPHEDADAFVEMRMRRQHRLQAGSGLTFSAIIDEAALRRPVGGAEVMAAQLQHLADMSGRGSIQLQVLPFDAQGHPGQAGAFSLLQFPGPTPPDLLYLEMMDGYDLVEDEYRVARYRSAYALMQGSSLGVDESRTRVLDMMRHLPSGP